MSQASNDRRQVAHEDALPLEDHERLSLLHQLQVHQVELEQQNHELRDALTRLEESERKYKLASDGASECIVWTDPDGAAHHISQSCQALFGGDEKATCISLPQFEAMIHPADRERFRRHHNRTLADLKPDEMEIRIIGPDGGERWIWHRCTPMYDETGRFIGRRSVNTDITEQREMLAAQRESEARLKLFIEYAPVALAMFDRQMRYLVASRRWREDYGLGDQELIGKSHFEIFPGMPEAWMKSLRRGMEGEVISADEDWSPRPDGKMQCLRWAMHPWFATDGSVGGICFFTEDVTERKLAQQAFEHKKAEYRNVLESTTDGFWCLAPDGRILSVNSAYVCRSGYSREELLTMSAAECEAQENQEELVRHIDRIMSHGSDLFQTRHRTKSGEVWPVEVSASYWPEGGGRVIAFMRDIGNRLKTEEELTRLHREMIQVRDFQIARQTVAAIAHELNQPLNAVATYSEVALRLVGESNGLPIHLRRAVEGAAEQSHRAGDVLHELLAFLESDEAAFDPVDLGQLVHNVLKLLASHFRSQFTPRLDIDPALGHVLANPRQIEKVLSILIENGIEAMSGKSECDRDIAISVRPDSQAGMVRTTIADRGSGISAETADLVFEPFFTTKRMGLGMGLTISRSIIEAHHGRLWVDSESGSGARFNFTLPLAS